MTIYFKKYIFILIIVSSLSGCAIWTANESEKMMTLGAALTKLSSAVESTVRYKNPPDDMSEKELLMLATNHDAALLTPFQDYNVRVHRQNRHAILLICSKEGDRALLEDSNCTGKLDRHLWESKPVRPCEFTLTVQEVCGAN